MTSPSPGGVHTITRTEVWHPPPPGRDFRDFGNFDSNSITWVTRNQGFMAHLIDLKPTGLLKSASMYGIGLNVQYIEANSLHSTLRQNRPQCTESASMNCSLIGSDTSHEKINYLCLSVPYIEANSVHWGQFHTLRPILYIEAKWWKCSKFLAFDTNSTSDWFNQMC